MFTLDKLIVALIKQACTVKPGQPQLTREQVQTVLSDSKCQDLLSLLESLRQTETVTNQDVIRYRREAERHVGQDDHLYKIQWVSTEYKS